MGRWGDGEMGSRGDGKQGRVLVQVFSPLPLVLNAQCPMPKKLCGYP